MVSKSVLLAGQNELELLAFPRDFFVVRAKGLQLTTGGFESKTTSSGDREGGYPYFTNILIGELLELATILLAQHDKLLIIATSPFL